MGNLTFRHRSPSTLQNINNNNKNKNNHRLYRPGFLMNIHSTHSKAMIYQQCDNNRKKTTTNETSKSNSSHLTTISSSKRYTTNSSYDSSDGVLFNNDVEIDKLRLELRDSKRQVYEREQQLLKLHREVHKLRSVLDHSDAISALKTTPSIDMLLNNNKIYTTNKLDIPPEKKKGVSGESFGSNKSDRSHNINFIWKDFDCRRIIQEALMDNSFLKNYLNPEQLDLIVNSMYEKEFGKNHFICRRGTYGSHLYVITYGHCEVIDARDRPVNQIGPGKAFGELALLYNCTRTASVRTLTRVRTWVLDRKVFQMIMMKTSLDRTESIKKFLKKVPLLHNLNDEKITKVTDAIEINYYPRGEYICRQGSFGDSFYIISKGSVRVTKVKNQRDVENKNGKSDQVQIKEETIRTLSAGDYFGEQALLLLESARESLVPETNTTTITLELSDNISAVRTANVISEDCECFVLNQTNFFKLLGELQEIKYKSYTDSMSSNNSNNFLNIPNESPSNKIKLEQKFEPPKDLNIFEIFIKNLTLDDLEVIAHLGMGGFGIVNLVRCKTDHDKVFAMKKCSKEFIRASRQQQHIVNEKLVMERVSGRNQFIIQLYRTFQDDRNVYFLMETALGGELWTVLRQRGPFNEQSVRFYTACVMEALQYLHSHNIIYRDLKPENCLLDANGYLKLTDFGFSKSLLAGEKTWTFCGTPEYVAPEIILNRGHDRSVDIWALGILIYELLTGMPPFISSDPLQTYHIILRGFDSIGFDENVFSKHCVNLIRSLCRENPNERLGICGRNGYNDIKRHKWFYGFSWNNLIHRKMSAPIIPKLTSNTDTRHFECFDISVMDSFVNDSFESNNHLIHADNNDNNHLMSNNKDKLGSSRSRASPSWFKPLATAKTSISTKGTTTNGKRLSSSDHGEDNQYETIENGLFESMNWESYF